eukprot:scaffold1397_cov254-Pinguiococcus_pyrenoidosus.AAC.61
MACTRPVRPAGSGLNPASRLARGGCITARGSGHFIGPSRCDATGGDRADREWFLECLIPIGKNKFKIRQLNQVGKRHRPIVTLHCLHLLPVRPVCASFCVETPPKGRTKLTPDQSGRSGRLSTRRFRVVEKRVRGVGFCFCVSDVGVVDGERDRGTKEFLSYGRWSSRAPWRADRWRDMIYGQGDWTPPTQKSITSASRESRPLPWLPSTERGDKYSGAWWARFWQRASGVESPPCASRCAPLSVSCVVEEGGRHPTRFGESNPSRLEGGRADASASSRTSDSQRNRC